MSTATPTIPTRDNKTTNPVGMRINVDAARMELARNWKWILTGGILSAAAGIVAIASPMLATALVGVTIIASLSVVGAVNLAGVFFVPRGMKMDSFLIGTVQLLTAGVIFFYPLQSVVSLTAMIAAVLMLQGVGRIAFGWATWELKGSGWVVASGIATVALCCMIVAGLPAAALWVIGLMFGVEMLSNGTARIAVALEGRRITRQADA